MPKVLCKSWCILRHLGQEIRWFSSVHDWVCLLTLLQEMSMGTWSHQKHSLICSKERIGSEYVYHFRGKIMALWFRWQLKKPWSPARIHFEWVANWFKWCYCTDPWRIGALQVDVWKDSKLLDVANLLYEMVLDLNSFLGVEGNAIHFIFVTCDWIYVLICYSYTHVLSSMYHLL